MIIQSPESAMPEPYKTYVEQRSKSISTVLRDVVGNADIQLCPRPITPNERLFSDGDEAYTYGVVVRDVSDGHKSILYSKQFANEGIATADPQMALEYFEEQDKKGNRVRVKDSRESDGKGQQTVESTDQLLSIFGENSGDTTYVLMPHLDEIQTRLSVGRIALGKFGDFCYIGLEDTTTHEDAEVYGGTKLGLFRRDAADSEAEVVEHLEVSHELVEIGKSTLETYADVALHVGRLSVDIVEGLTDSGENFQNAIDVTPRMGGTTPAEVLAIKTLYRESARLCFASSQLIYHPVASPVNGMNFIDTESLVINADINEVR